MIRYDNGPKGVRSTRSGLVLSRAYRMIPYTLMAIQAISMMKADKLKSNKSESAMSAAPIKFSSE